MQNAESTYPLFCSIESSLTLPASPKVAYVSNPSSTGMGGQSFWQEGIHVNLCFQLVVQQCFLISRDAASHRAFDCGQAKTGQSVASSLLPHPPCENNAKSQNLRKQHPVLFQLGHCFGKGGGGTSALLTKFLWGKYCHLWMLWSFMGAILRGCVCDIRQYISLGHIHKLPTLCVLALFGTSLQVLL